MSTTTLFVWHGDGREQAVAILEAIDEWSQSNEVLMTVGSGPERGGKFMDVISQVRPDTMVEFGGYIGYSAIKFGNAVRSSGGKRYISLEGNAEYAELARKLVTLAGLDEFVEIIVGPISEYLAKLRERKIDVDVFFIDHDESLYASDLKLADGLGLVRKDCWVLADNIVGDRTRDYRELLGPANDDLRGLNRAQTYETSVFYFDLPTGKKDGLMLSRRL
ncbi:O-methyltransferase [Plectosphaerella plurivora]|uniref:catechol O-methyltransferase n=1 Tax=Plectosphaerella plurivora TaxID=936078 RepID=A0A9P8VAF8_9PEZI|nr:O-methyltransferase [Plectosphaerella plurivora]